MTIALLAVGTALSIAMILLLWSGDPKRRRVVGLSQPGAPAPVRRLTCAIALLPGLILAGIGDASAFLVWFGCCALAGWLAAQLPGPGGPG